SPRRARHAPRAGSPRPISRRSCATTAPCTCAGRRRSPTAWAISCSTWASRRHASASSASAPARRTSTPSHALQIERADHVPAPLRLLLPLEQPAEERVLEIAHVDEADAHALHVVGGGVAQLTGEGDPGREEAPHPLRPCPVSGRGAPPRRSRVTV